jgi:hypothetical protein
VGLELRLREGVAQPLLDQADGEVGDVDPDPPPPELLRRMHRVAAAAEGVEHEVAGIAGGGDDALEQGDGLLGCVPSPAVVICLGRP